MPRSLSQRPASLGWFAFCALALSLLASACNPFTDDLFIAYTLGQADDRDIAVVRADGEDQQVIIGGDTDDFTPVWSPSHDRLAFLSRRDGNTEVYLARADGSNAIRATDTAVDESQVTWSPDGKRIAYSSPDNEGRPRIYWLHIDDLISNPLVFGGNGEVDPAWSPNGTWVAFAALAEDGSSTGLFLRNPDGVIQFQITEAPDRTPTWSPDGKRLAFVRTVGSPDNSAMGEEAADRNDDIWVIQIDDNGPASQEITVTTDDARDYAPTWSPDNERIAFLSTRNGANDIFTIARNGDDLQGVTRSEINELSVQWGSDGRIVFASIPGDRSELYVDDDGMQIRISKSAVASSEPNW